MTRGSGQGQRCLDPPAPVRGGGCLGPADGGMGAAAHGVAVQVVPRARRFGERKRTDMGGSEYVIKRDNS